MERQLAVHARAHRASLRSLLAAAVIVTTSTSAIAAPTGATAKAAFDRGVKAYTEADYAAASEALAASYALEADAETLFAWAQTERQRGRCEKAIELYDELLAFDLPAENEAAAQAKLDECKAILAAQPPSAAPASPPAPDRSAPDEPVAESPAATGARAWWQDPVGGGLVALGVIGVGVGGVFLVSARSADRDKDSAATYGEYQLLEERAASRGRLGVIAAATGGVLLGAGIVWYATRGDARGPQVTGWFTAEGGGLVAAGRF